MMMMMMMLLIFVMQMLLLLLLQLHNFMCQYGICYVLKFECDAQNNEADATAF